MTAPPFEYVRDPAEIARQSFAAIRRLVDADALPADIRGVALRLVHATGDPSLVDALVWSDGAGTAGRAALQSGAAVFADVAMVAAGITRARLPAGNAVVCTLDAAGVEERARAAGITRSAAGVELWDSRLDGAVVAVGNAPTALFRLLELLAEGHVPRPALILGMPVGFIGAAESKQALAESGLGVPFITLAGRRGGSALAAAAVNALASERELSR